MTAKLDIHNFEKQIKEEIQRLETSNLSKKNKDLIKSFVRDVSINEGPATPTKIKYYQVLRIIIQKYLDNQDMDLLKFDDLKNLKFKLGNSKTYFLQKL